MTHLRRWLPLALLCASTAVFAADRPNILVIWGDDIGQSNISAYTFGLVGYRTPNIDRIAREGMMFTDYYGEQSCTAGRSSFIMGQSVFRTGLSKVGLPGVPQLTSVVLGATLEAASHTSSLWSGLHLSQWLLH